NKTGVEIHEVYVSPVSTDDWEEDVLGKGTLPDGESVKITFNDREKHVHWDLKIVDGKGNSIEWHDLNLIEIDELTLHYKDGKAWADVKYLRCALNTTCVDKWVLLSVPPVSSPFGRGWVRVRS